jgi:hypothetical protein
MKTVIETDSHLGSKWLCFCRGYVLYSNYPEQEMQSVT